MTTRTAERIDGWESRPFSGGYAGLQDLAANSFSGVVRAGPATCCMLNGTVVGVVDGTIEDFEDASGTVREAPSPALPLLMVMQEGDSEVRTKYYSEDTPLSEADQKLSDGGFTGYIELSENVLSGDYYVVYHGGRSMSVAYVGESEKLLTDDEAFDRADDEVGIYKVHTADVAPIEIPEPEEDDQSTAVAAGATGTTEDDEEAADATSEELSDDAGTTAVDDSTGAEQETADTDTTDAVARESTADPEQTAADPAQTTVDADSPDEEPTRERESRTDAATAASRPPIDESDDEAVSDSPGGPADRDRPEHGDRSGQVESSPRSHQRESSAETQSRRAGASREDRPERRHANREPEPERRTDEDSGGDPLAAPEGSQESTTAGAALGQPGELERRSIPSVDPDKTWTAGEDGPSEPPRTPLEPRKVESGSSPPRSAGSTPSRDDSSRSSTPQQSTSSGRPDSSELVAEIREKERTIESLEGELADLESERDAVAAERDDLQSELRSIRDERDELQAEVDRLRSTVSDLETQLEGAAADTVDASVQLSPGEAIDKTNLFVRYGSKGDATLKAAHAGDADRDAVNANLDLEYHTQFEAADAAVDGEDFETFLTRTIQYQFVDWVVHDLLYEIRDTGHASALRDLFDALPRLDRAELNGSVSISYTEDGEQHRSQKQFDIVLRDRMGNPLAVANINDSREAATGDMMSSLVTDATRVGESSDTLAGAFLVTSSFFDPGALETASEATGGGLLSRDKRESFVRLSRKQGYHLCLVEARDEKFHLAVPEL